MLLTFDALVIRALQRYLNHFDATNLHLHITHRGARLIASTISTMLIAQTIDTDRPQYPIKLRIDPRDLLSFNRRTPFCHIKYDSRLLILPDHALTILPYEGFLDYYQIALKRDITDTFHQISKTSTDAFYDALYALNSKHEHPRFIPTTLGIIADFGRGDLIGFAAPVVSSRELTAYLIDLLEPWED